MAGPGRGDYTGRAERQRTRNRANARLTAEVVLEVIRQQVCGDVRALFDARGNMKPIHTLTREEAMLIAGLEIIILGDGKTKLAKIRLTDRARFVEMAARHLRLLTDTIEITAGAEIVEILRARMTRVEQQRVLPPAPKTETL